MYMDLEIQMLGSLDLFVEGDYGLTGGLMELKCYQTTGATIVREVHKGAFWQVVKTKLIKIIADTNALPIKTQMFI